MLYLLMFTGLNAPHPWSKEINFICSHVMPKGAIFKKECKTVLFNSFVMLQFLSLTNFFSLLKSKNSSQNIKCALFYELIFL